MSAEISQLNYVCTVASVLTMFWLIFFGGCLINYAYPPDCVWQCVQADALAERSQPAAHIPCAGSPALWGPEPVWPERPVAVGPLQENLPISKQRPVQHLPSLSFCSIQHNDIALHTHPCGFLSEQELSLLKGNHDRWGIFELLIFTYPLDSTTSKYLPRCQRAGGQSGQGQHSARAPPQDGASSSRGSYPEGT